MIEYAIKNLKIQTRAYSDVAVLKAGVLHLQGVCGCESMQVNMDAPVCEVTHIPADRTFLTIHSNPFILSAMILRPELWCDPHLNKKMRESRWEPGQPHWRPWSAEQAGHYGLGASRWAP